MTTMRRWNLFGCFVAGMLLQIAAAAGSGVSEFRARLFSITSNDGLSQGFVSSVVQDHRGFIWFATKDGLNRYDGYTYKVYRNDPANIFSLADNIVLQIFEDSRGYLWVSSTRGLQVFDPVSETFSSVPITIDGKPGVAPVKMAEDKSGNIWCHASGTFICLRVEEQAGETSTVFQKKYKVVVSGAETVFGEEVLKHPEATDFFSDPEGDFWLADSDAVYFCKREDMAAGKITARYDFATFTALGNARIICARADEQRKTMTFVSQAGVSVYSLETFRLVRAVLCPVSSINWFSAVAGGAGNTWFATKDGLFFYSDSLAQVEKFIPLNTDSSVWNSCVIRSILVDRSGIVWMGTNGFGVFRYNPRVSCFNLVDQLGISMVTGTNDGRVAVAVRGDNLFWLDRKTCRIGAPAFHERKFVHVFEGKEHYPRDFRQDSNGIIWLSYGYATIGRYDEKTGDIRFFSIPLRNAEKLTDYGCIWLDSANHTWITAELMDSSYIARFNASTETFDIVQRIPEKKSNWMYAFVSAAFTDVNENTWIGTTSGLLCYSVKTGQWKSYHNIPGDKTSLSCDIVFSVCADPTNPGSFIWAGTGSGGLNRLDIAKGTFTHFTDKDGLPNNVLYGLLPDRNGNLWISTNRGICRFSTATATCKSYFAGDGLQGNEFNRYVYYAASDGALYFGGVNGMNFFYPRELSRPSVPPQLVFTGFRLFNSEVLPGDSSALLSRPIDFTSRIELRHDQNVIMISFAAMDFSAPEKNQFRYKLEGFDKDWNFSGTRNEAIYTGLEPGEYRLLVSATGSEGIWSPENRAITIVVLPPWWRTWWATTIFIFLGISVIALIILLRTMNLQRSRKMLEEKVEERTRELNDTITSLRNTQKQLIKNEKLASFGQLTAGIAHEIKNPLNFINNFSELSNELIEELKLTTEQQERDELMKELQNNIEKISFHGNRVDSIIRSMLNHSRTAGARRQQTDINKLCEEFSNLAYHSMRANVPDFNCTLRSEYEEGIPGLMVISQDISRVLLNLLNNAFYAVNEKRKTADPGYRPLVKISTRKAENSVIISIRDNGCGIPASQLDKLFDPFFTTKPTGEGTGLGLSIAYDIIDSHGGRISIDSKDGEYTEFTIQLPFEGVKKAYADKLIAI